MGFAFQLAQWKLSVPAIVRGQKNGMQAQPSGYLMQLIDCRCRFASSTHSARQIFILDRYVVYSWGLMSNPEMGWGPTLKAKKEASRLSTRDCCSLSLKQQLPWKRQRYWDRFSKRSTNEVSETLSAEHHAASSTRSSRRSPRSHLLTNDWVAFSLVAISSWVSPLCTRVSRSKARKRSYSEE